MEEVERDFSKELDVAVRIVHLACALCQRVQRSLKPTNADQVKSKDDDSLVTVAGNSFIPPLFLILCDFHFLNLATNMGVFLSNGCSICMKSMKLFSGLPLFLWGFKDAEKLQIRTMDSMTQTVEIQ